MDAARHRHLQVVPERAAAETSTTSSKGAYSYMIPLIIVEGVVEVLGRELEANLHVLRHLWGTDDYNTTHVVTTERRQRERDLRNLGSVHPSYAPISKRMIGRFLHIENFSEKKLGTILRDPCFGPWTREILLHDPDEGYGEEWELYDELFNRMSNTRRLLAYTRDLEHVLDNLLWSLPRLQSLEELRVFSTLEDETTPYPFLHLAQKLAQLPRLRYLALRGCVPDVDDTDELATALTSNPLVASILTMRESLKPAFALSERLRYMSWIRGPDAKFTLHTLSIQLEDSAASIYDDGRDYWLADLKPLCTMLQRLFVKGDESSEMRSRIVAQCPALRELTADISYFPSDVFLNALPRSIEDIAIIVWEVSDEDTWKLWDARLAAYIAGKTSPTLASFTLALPSVVEYLMILVEDDSPPAFWLTKEACARRGVIFDFGVTDVFFSGNTRFHFP